MTSHEVYTKQGIYHGLPTFPASLKDQTAIVTGANGISGQYMLRVLLNSPSRWKKIYALSRTPPTGIKSSRVEHIAVDLLSGVDKIEEELIKRNVRANYVFFFAYKEVSGKGGELWAGQEQMVQENGMYSLCRSKVQVWFLLDVTTRALQSSTSRLHPRH